jgi:hypothetical protein
MTEANWATWAQLFYNGAYNVLPDLVDAGQAVTLERGVADDLDLKPGVCTFRLNDDTDAYRPSNAASALYPQIAPWAPGAFATGGSVRFTGQITKASPDQTPYLEAVAGTLTRGVRWVDFTLGGTLARVAKLRDPGSSALLAQINSYATNLRGYWPLEDLKGATLLANQTPNGKPGTFITCTPAADDGPPGSAPVLGIGTGGAAFFTYSPMSQTAGWQLAWAMELPNVSVTSQPVFAWKTTSGHTWTFSASTTQYQIDIVDSDGTSLLSASSLTGTEANAQDGRWIYHRFKVHASGGTTTVEWSWYNSDAQTFWGVTSTYAGAPGAPRTGLVPANATTAGGHYGHHFVVTGNTDDLESVDFTQAFTGFATELAADRFTRLMTGRGLPFLIRGDPDLTAEMGPQPIDTFQAQLKQIRATEGGLIFDRGEDLGIVLTTRAQLYANALDPLDLTWPGDIAPPFKEITDAEVYNLVTARNANGSTYTVELTDGRLSTADPPAGAGAIDKTVDVNLAADSRLPSVATWWMRFWTQGQPRFDQVVIDVDEHPELLTACNAAEPGTFIRITGRTPDPLLLMIISTGQKTHRKRNVFTFGVVAGAVFQVGTYDGTDRYDALTSTLTEDLTTTETAADVIATSWGSTWSSTAVPYPVDIAGERCTCTAASTPVASGLNWTQTLTLTRSVNGVVKNQTTGTEVHIADQRRYA